jgi:putative phosphoesterase
VSIIGLISDTHGLVRPEVLSALQGSDLIVHAGDIGAISVLEALSTIAPVTAIRGNIDKEQWALKYPQDAVLEIENRAIYVLHNVHELDLDPVAAGFDVVVSGHSHKPDVTEKDGVLYVNPGSAGPRRFRLPVAIAKMEVTEHGVSASVTEIVV